MKTGGTYDPNAIESEIYEFWEDAGYFHAEPNAERPPYVIDIPLPNVTGALHLGHALNNSVQDILIRHHRMRGFEAMWMPGTDHAGIATQAVVERKLKEEQNLTRHELGRDGLVAKIWEWKEDYGGRILNQLRKLGASCDWDRTRFTLDEVCARAVYEVFFEWFKAGLIYRGLRLVNWDAYLQTAVADDEIVHETVKGHFWHLRYPLLSDEATTRRSEGGAGLATFPVDAGAADAAIANASREDAAMGTDYLIVATTRPETMLGDTAVCVHPSDERYQHLIGRYALLPLQNRAIPIVADPLLAKMELGTGCVKVTPGHDPNDYACGQRNGLEMINILTNDGHINENGGRYAGQDRYDARKKVVADLESLGLMEKVEDYEHEVGHSDRSKTPIEPMLSEQWFVKMPELCELAMEAARDGRVQFYPQRYEKTFLDWLGEKRDWCISRQLWWGHRIPVWTLRHHPWEKCGYVSREAACGERPGAIRDVFQDVGWALGAELDDEYAVQIVDDGTLRVCCRTDRAHDVMRSLRRGVVDGFEAALAAYDLTRVDADLQGSVRNDFEELISELVSVEQDPDVLDTWFSSALWPFSTLGWPDNYGKEPIAGGSTDLDYFYPTTVLVTSRDIITLWVARMVMTGLYFQGRVPFSHVHIHPVIQDGMGKRMSKSTGNGVDPLDIIHLYGTDALRFTMAQMDSETQDARLPVDYICPHCNAEFGQKPQHYGRLKVKCEKCKQEFATRVAGPELHEQLGLGLTTSPKFELGRNFCNKIWQASTGFVMPNLQGSGNGEPEAGALTLADLAVEDRWILSRLAGVIADIDRRFARYQINEVANTVYSFFWNDFCDWYVELVKPRLFQRDASGEVATRTDATSGVARRVLAHVLDQSLRLMHPIMPFISEALWQQLNEVAPQRGLCAEGTGDDVRYVARAAEPALIKAAWPDATAFARDRQVEREIAALQDVIRALRDTLARINTARAASKAGAIGKLPAAVIRADATIADGLQAQVAVLERLGRCEQLMVGADAQKPPESATQVLSGVEVYVPLGGLMDLAAERKRLEKERDNLRGHIERLKGKLANEGFVSKAPAAVVEQERARLADLQDRLDTLERNLADISA